MKIFKALKKLITYLTEEENNVSCKQPSVQKELEENLPVQEEESIMNTKIENPYVSQVRDWAIDKINLLCDEDSRDNARALAHEFYEWIDISDESDCIEYLYIQDNNWSEDGEIDVI
jgi:hypothetical protein